MGFLLHINTYKIVKPNQSVINIISPAQVEPRAPLLSTIARRCRRCFVLHFRRRETRPKAIAKTDTKMSRIASITKLARQINGFNQERVHFSLSSTYSTLPKSPTYTQIKQDETKIPTTRTPNPPPQIHIKDIKSLPKLEIGENIPRRDKISFLVTTLIDLQDNKESIYNTLDAWVAWEREFPIGALKNVLLALEKQQQWHKVIQVIKWMLSKGQGNTRGTYGQLIRALDMDHRVEEAHEIWKKKLGFDLHSVPWKLCKLMISVYYRNNMLEDLVKLFKGLEGFDRKPPEKSIVQRVADAYEVLGLSEEKERVLEKYKSLFVESSNGKTKKIGRSKKISS